MHSATACLAVLFALVSASSAFDANRPAHLLRKDVAIENERFRIAFNRLQPAQMVAFYGMPFRARFPGFPPITDRAVLLGAYMGLFAAPSSLEFTKVVINRTAPRTYVATNTFLVTAPTPTGPSTRTGKIILTWKVDGAIPKIADDHTISD